MEPANPIALIHEAFSLLKISLKRLASAKTDSTGRNSVALQNLS